MVYRQEFAHPHELLKIPNSQFSELVAQTGHGQANRLARLACLDYETKKLAKEQNSSPTYDDNNSVDTIDQDEKSKNINLTRQTNDDDKREKSQTQISDDKKTQSTIDVSNTIDDFDDINAEKNIGSNANNLTDSNKNITDKIDSENTINNNKDDTTQNTMIEDSNMNLESANDNEVQITNSSSENLTNKLNNNSEENNIPVSPNTHSQQIVDSSPIYCRIENSKISDTNGSKQHSDEQKVDTDGNSSCKNNGNANTIDNIVLLDADTLEVTINGNSQQEVIETSRL